MPASHPLAPEYPVVNDPARPTWHFAPPAQWMNDPNGPFWCEGWYHLFYQHNPGAAEWGDLHWGHARSRDLVNWEHLPIALGPRHDAGEMHCYSGCAALAGDATPRIIYTSVPHDSARGATQVMASPLDREFVRWSQAVEHPVLALATHGGPAFDRDWRDPYVFHVEARTFLILGATLGDEAVIPLYESTDPGLREWVYRGILHRAPKSETRFFECPNFLRFGSKWVLVTSPCREVEWQSGTFDLENYQFRPERGGRVDHSDHYYATQTVINPEGQMILFGWVQKFPKGQAWNGCLALPRRVWLDERGTFCGEPLEALAALRTTAVLFESCSLERTPVTLSLPTPGAHEVDLLVDWGAASNVRCSVEGITISIGTSGVQFNDGPTVPWSDRPSSIRIRWLLDHSLLEVFVGPSAIYTRVISHPAGCSAQLSSDGPARLIAGSAWTLSK